MGRIGSEGGLRTVIFAVGFKGGDAMPHTRGGEAED